jgi:hypothetical protein
MKYARTVTGWLLIGLLGGALAQGCGSSTNPRRNVGSAANSGSAGKDSGSMTVEPRGNAGNGGAPEYDPMCGIPDGNFCVPDLEMNTLCVETVAGSGGSSGTGNSRSGRGGTGGKGVSTGGSGPLAGGTGRSMGGTGMAAGGRASTSPGGAGGESGADGSTEGGMSQGGAAAAAGENTASGAVSGQGGENPGSAGQVGGAGVTGQAATGGGLASGGHSGSAGQTTGGRAGASSMASVSCQVVENPAHKGSPLATCRAAGTGTEGAPCFSGSDCAPSFACVGDGPGQCRAYCCSGPDQCQRFAGFHCAAEPLVTDVKGTRTLEVPVCMPAVKCSLAEPYPCPDNVVCSCPKDSACMVVSDDGTTSCLPVSALPPTGFGRAGQPCPCAPGNVCSQATNDCVELCEVAAPDSCMSGSGRCQASAALPAGWGTCIGVAPKDAGAQ